MALAPDVILGSAKLCLKIHPDNYNRTHVSNQLVLFLVMILHEVVFFTA